MAEEGILCARICLNTTHRYGSLCEACMVRIKSLNTPLLWIETKHWVYRVIMMSSAIFTLTFVCFLSLIFDTICTVDTS